MDRITWSLRPWFYIFHNGFLSLEWSGITRQLLIHHVGVWSVVPLTLVLHHMRLHRGLSKMPVSKAIVRDLPRKMSVSSSVIMVTTYLLLVNQREKLSVLALHNLGHCLVHEI